MKTQKTVQVLTIYRFKETARICFVVESSNGLDTYHTCFNRDENHGSCTCPAIRGCYHLDQLKARAAEYFQSRQPAKVEQVLTAEDIASLVDPDIEVMQPVKANPVQEAQQFINRVVAEKMAIHNAAESTFESAPSGRLVPMR